MSIVAIVGRPNVGKSTLFNMLIREKRAIVGPERGITRDRITGRWNLDDDHSVDLVDTGGFDTIMDTVMDEAMRRQTMAAIQEADVILGLFDASVGTTPDDEELVRILRTATVPVIYVASKVDDPNGPLGCSYLYELGLSDFVTISAQSRYGIKDLKQIVLDALPEEDHTARADDDAVRVSILGRPNVGKSMMTNRIIGEERAIVSPEAGTTRDYVDIRVERGNREYVFVDTAGIRRKTRINDEIERSSVMRAIRNINNAHVCLLLVDPQEGITEQDRRLCRLILEHGRPFVLVVNKSDLVNAKEREMVKSRIDYFLRYLPDLKIVFTSALTGRNVDKLYPVIDSLFDKTTRAISTGRLNQVIQRAGEAHPAPIVKGRRLKFYYATQTGNLPPRFRIVANRPDSVPAQYEKYLLKTIKKALDLEGIPVKLDFVPRSTKDKE